MAADFVPPQFNPPPDFLASMIRGQMAPIQQQAAALQLSQAQALAPGQLEQQGLTLSQLRMLLQNQQAYQDVAFQQLRSQGFLGAPGSNSAGAQSTQGTPTGGIQNGPQGSVSAPTDSSMPTSSQSPAGPSDGSVMGWTPTTLGALAVLRGDDPLKTAQGVQDYQMKQRQIQAAGPMSLAESVASSPQADVIIKNNPSLQQQWVQIAPKLGLDPFRDLTPQNARMVATYAYNQLAGASGQVDKIKPMPVQYRQSSTGYGELEQRGPLDNKVDILRQPQYPTATVEKVTNPDLTESAVSIPTGGLDAAGRPLAMSGPMAMGGGNNAANGSGVNLGRGAPTEPEAKAAGFASSMRQGVATLRQMEGSGYELSPTDRATLINVASDENPGLITQWWKQELLAHKLDPQGQAYLAATMPVIQALSHDQSGARLNSSTIRANLESAIPIDTSNKAAMQQIEGFRDNYYKSMLIGAGKAAYTAAFNNSLGADLRSMAASQNNRGSGAHPANIQALLDKYGAK